MPAFISFGAIYVNTQENSAGIFFGETVANGWDAHSKNNQALGQIFGNGVVVLTPINLLNDPDVLDAIMSDPDVEASPVLQT